MARKPASKKTAPAAATAAPAANPDVEAAWEAGIPHYINYWAGAVKGVAGMEVQNGHFKAWCDPARPLDADLAMLAEPYPDPVCILDIGSGPVATCGWVLEGRRIQVTPVDPFALYFWDVMEWAKAAAPPVVSIQSDPENLLDVVPAERFHMAYMNRSLVQCYDPERAIAAAFGALVPGGTLVIRAQTDSSEAAGYFALHQWNLRAGPDGDIEIWRPGTSWRLADLCPPGARIHVNAVESFLTLVIQKAAG